MSKPKEKSPLNKEDAPKKRGCPVGPSRWTKDAIEKERVALLDWVQDEKNYYLDSFAVSRGYSRKQIHDLAEMDPSFSHAFEKAKTVQECRLVRMALEKRHDGNFTKFVLANRAGWSERQAISVQSDALSEILVSIDGKTKEIVESDQDDEE
jgi:hypothetical protein